VICSTLLIVNTAPTRPQLENDIFTVAGIVQKYNCALKRLDFQQEQGYMSSLILGSNAIEIQRGMTTSSTAIFVPFMTQELRMGVPAIYYGQNARSSKTLTACFSAYRAAARALPRNGSLSTCSLLRRTKLS